MKDFKIRLARPSWDLKQTEKFYCNILGMKLLGSFTDHDGFDGIMIGNIGSLYHLEFTKHRSSPVTPTPRVEDLLFF